MAFRLFDKTRQRLELEEKTRLFNIQLRASGMYSLLPEDAKKGNVDNLKVYVEMITEIGLALNELRTGDKLELWDEHHNYRTEIRKTKFGIECELVEKNCN